METFHMPFKYQNGAKVLKRYEWRCQGIKRRFGKPKPTRAAYPNNHMTLKGLESIFVFTFSVASTG